MTSRPDRGSLAQVSERVRRRLEVLETTAEAQVAPRRWALREAAALLTAFDPETLEAEGEAGDALLELIDDCDTVGDPTRRRWTLKRDVRVAALRRLSGGEEALRSLETNGDPDVRPVEHAVRAYLQGSAPPLDSQDLEGLGHSLQALRWLGEIPGLSGVPPAEEAMRVYAGRRLFSPLESLIAHGFHGREAELSELRLHVGVLELTTLSTKLRGARRRLNPLATPTEKPMVVHGPPGIGKSTLLAKFVLDHARAGDRRIPFVFIDFERPTLSVLEPATLLAEAARQLAIQYPDSDADLGEIADAASHEARRGRDEALAIEEREDLAADRESAQAAGRRARAEEDGLVRRLADAVRAAVPPGSGEPPLLIVLDSFEQAQYRSSPHLRRLWDLFDAFQRWYPSVRVVVSGRAPVDELPVNRRAGKELKLEEFDRAASVAFLLDEGVADERLAELIAGRFGGNPLSLKLAAGLARRAGPQTDWVDDTPTRRWLLFRVEDEQIQSRLYHRLLASIADPEIAALAHPGLILRRITPAVIQEVLAGPCEVAVPDTARAEALFDGFARQVDLVERDGDALVHRPDVRRDMLALVEQDRPATVEAIERAAVAFYTARPGAQARAEEIYHRLRLGEDPRSVDERWEDGVERHLWGAEAELPARAQAHLAARLRDARATPEALAEADDEDWETLVAREVDDLLDQAGDEGERRGRARAALELMGARSGWSPTGPLPRLQAEALDLAGDRAAAEEAVEEGLAALDDRRMPATAAVPAARLDLLLLAARLSTGALADRRLEEAEELALRLGRPADALGALLMRVRLQGAEATEVRRRAARRFLELDGDALERHPALVRSIAAELGAEDADVLQRAIDVLGVRSRTAADLEDLERAVRARVAEDASFAAWLDDLASRRGVRRAASGSGVRTLVEHLDATGRLGELARPLVASGDEGVRAHVIDMLGGPR